MKAVRYYENADGSWTAWIFSRGFTGTYIECMEWLRANGEEPCPPRP